MSIFRKKYVTTTSRRVMETGLFALGTISVCVLSISFGDMNGCQTPNKVEHSVFGESGDEEINIHNLQRWTCGKDENGQ